MNSQPSDEAGAGATTHYTTHAGDALRDRDEILAIWQDHFGPPASQAAKFDHFYRHCPFGPAFIQLLRHHPGGELAGVIGAGPRPMLWQGNTIRAAVVAHFAVHPQHRALGPALQLQRALIEAARGQVDLLYGLPRPNAVAVSRRAGFSVLGELTRHAKILRHGVYLQRRMPTVVAAPVGALVDLIKRLPGRIAATPSPGLRWQWTNHADPRMDTLWRDSRHTSALTSVRDHAMLQSRFDQAPADRARYLLVEDAEGHLQAWFACETDCRAGEPLAVMDYWSSTAMTGTARPLIRALESAARSNRHSAIHLLLGSNDDALEPWQAEGYVARSAQPVIGLWLNQGIVPTGNTDLHVAWIDQDG